MSYNRPGSGFQRTTPAVLNLIIINVIVFVVQMLFSRGNTGGDSIDDLFALHYFRSEYFRPHQIITHMFMHASFFHILFNMYALWMFGSIVERIWGPKRFLIFYFLCGIGAAVAQTLSYAYMFREVPAASQLSPENWESIQDVWRGYVTVGASGAIMGVVAAFGYLFPNTEMMIIPIPIPIKAKWLVIGYILFDLFSGVAGSADNVAHFAHVGGALTGFIIVLIWNKTNKKTFY